MNLLSIGDNKIVNLDGVLGVQRVRRKLVVNATSVEADVTSIAFSADGGKNPSEYTGEIGDQLWYYFQKNSTAYDKDKLPPKTPDSITVAPVTYHEVPKGGTEEFTALGLFPGYDKDVSDRVKWSSTDEKVATITDKGVATGVAPGLTSIVATIDTVQGSFVLTVVDAAPLPPPVPAPVPTPPEPVPPPWPTPTPTPITPVPPVTSETTPIPPSNFNPHPEGPGDHS